MKELIILGASGSIGTQALEIVQQDPDRFRVAGISVNDDWEAAARIAGQTGVGRVAVGDRAAADKLREALPALEVLDGPQGIVELAGAPADLVIAAISGSAGLPSTIAAVRAGTAVALANKESLVCGGPGLLELARAHGSRVLPVDSEHSAIFQCMACGRADEVASILLTASGGPFRYASRAEIASATPAQALAHPNWAMGVKNSLDSATLANKGLELIEACFFFGVPESAVEVLINPTSLLHSAVQYVDGSMIAQLGHADMRGPIAFAMNWPERRPNGLPSLRLGEVKSLEFWPPDDALFPSLGLARQAVRVGQAGTMVFNAANEVAGRAFLAGAIGFTGIPAAIRLCLETAGDRFAATIDDAVHVDGEAKRFCAEQIERMASA